jgi:cytochrome c551
MPPREGSRYSPGAMIKVLSAALIGTVLGIIVMVVVLAASGTDTSGASSVGLGSLNLSTASATTAPSSTPSSSGGGSTGGTSTGASGDAAKGQTIFQNTCSTCHVTTPGQAPTVGPNLADLAPKLTEARILLQIKNGGAIMPAGLVSGQDATDVAAYVLSLGK